MKRYFLLLSIFLVNQAIAQFNEYNPEYNWLTIKGEHVYVHYHEEAERTAFVVAKIGDEVWGPITSLYEYEPEEVHYVIKDIDDYSNGATYFFDNKIEIWASALDFDLRGTHNWLRNVISHEFTHLVQIQAGMKLTRSIPAFYLQFLNYEDKRRPDILYGFPNVIVSYPVPTINIPAWFAEGTAQYMRAEFNYDNWDTHRDMILRSYALDNSMLTWNEMGVFNKTSLGNESVYNSGFALTRYIAQKYGEDKLRKITEQLGKLGNFTIGAAFEDVLGKDGDAVYNEWSEYLKSEYEKRIADVKDNLVTGGIIAEEGFGNFYPTFSPDGKKIYYISNKSADYFGLSGIYEYDIATGSERQVESNVRSTFGFVKGKNKIIYSKLSDDNPKWTNIHDLYVYDLSEEEETRLTFGLRANTPGVSNDGKKIVFTYQKDGTTNIGTVNIDGTDFKQLTIFANGEQVYNPKFSPDDSFIIFDYSYHNTRDIARINTDGSGFEFILQTDNDERNPAFAMDSTLYFASDRTGIFNIYKMDLATGEIKQLTNVIGGAFMPDVSEDGTVIYAGYTSTGYKIFKIDETEQKKVDESKNYVWLENPPIGKTIKNGDIAQFDIDNLRNFNDYETPEYDPKPYSGFFSRMSFFPFIRYDNYVTSNETLDRIKPGVYLASSDYLNRYSLFGGLSINKQLERDAFLTFEYRDKLPILYSLGLKPQVSLELYSISRKTDVDIFFGEYVDTMGVTRYDYIVPTDVTYNLFEVDLAFKHKIFTEGNAIEFRFIYSDYVATLGSFTIPNENTLYPTTDDKYFIGRNLQLKYTHKLITPTVDSDINPVGREIEVTYNYEFDKFNDDGEYQIEDGVLIPVYKNFNFHRLEVLWKEHIDVFDDHTINTTFRGATIFGPQIPDFFDFYLGGLVGMKSYPFYSISGNELGWINFTYRFPLLRNLDTRIGHLYIDKIYLSVYGDFGNAWNGELPKFDEFKKGAGAEIRIKMNSFYLFPTSIFFNAAYSFDTFNREVRDEIVTYGKEWRFYGGILFDFTF